MTMIDHSASGEARIGHPGRSHSRFSERMSGCVSLLPAAYAESVSLPTHDVAVGDGTLGDRIVDLARRAEDAATLHDLASSFDRDRIDLVGLRFVIEPTVSARDGLRASAVGGRISGLCPTLDGPVVAGFADLLHRCNAGERRSYYRLVSGGPRGDGSDGWLVVDGVKVIAGRGPSIVRQASTLYARVSKLPNDSRTRAWIDAVDGPVEGAAMLSAGVLRSRPVDLLRQAGSLRGARSLAGGFAKRLGGER